MAGNEQANGSTEQDPSLTQGITQTAKAAGALGSAAWIIGKAVDIAILKPVTAVSNIARRQQDIAEYRAAEKTAAQHDMQILNPDRDAVITGAEMKGAYASLQSENVKQGIDEALAKAGFNINTVGDAATIRVMPFNRSIREDIASSYPKEQAISGAVDVATNAPPASTPSGKGGKAAGPTGPG